MTDVSRRDFLRGAAGVGIGAAILPILSACAPAAPSAPSASGGGTSASGGKVKLPAYVALPNLPPPDLPGTPDGLLAPGYNKYPTNLVKSVPTPPGKGGE